MCDPDSIFTQFMVYKIAVQDNNVKKGVHKTLVVKALVVCSWQFYYNIFRIFSVVMRLCVCTSCRGSECDGNSG